MITAAGIIFTFIGAFLLWFLSKDTPAWMIPPILKTIIVVSLGAGISLLLVSITILSVSYLP